VKRFLAGDCERLIEGFAAVLGAHVMLREEFIFKDGILNPASVVFSREVL
jgi:hypothetical protein